MPVTLEQAIQMLSEPKWVLTDDLSWHSETDRQSNHVWRLKTRARTVHAMPRGLWFRARQWQDKPNVVVFQLESETDKKSRHVLYRLELNPFGTHLNAGFGPSNLAGLFIDAGVTHEHSYDFYEGMDGAAHLPVGDPFAAIVSNPPKEFDSALTHACARMNIMNQGEIPSVPLQNLLV